MPTPTPTDRFTHDCTVFLVGEVADLFRELLMRAHNPLYRPRVLVLASSKSCTHIGLTMELLQVRPLPAQDRVWDYQAKVVGFFQDMPEVPEQYPLTQPHPFAEGQIVEGRFDLSDEFAWGSAQWMGIVATPTHAETLANTA
jgi:hypothetical protein